MALSCSKKLSALLRGITPKYHGDFYCLNCLHSFATKNKRESHKKVCKNKDFGNVAMPSEDTKILELNQYQKSDKEAFIIYVDLEYLTEKLDLWQAHYQILSVIFLKEFIKLKVKVDTMIKNVKLSEVNINIVTIFLNTQFLKMI